MKESVKNTITSYLIGIGIIINIVVFYFNYDNYYTYNENLERIKIIVFWSNLIYVIKAIICYYSIFYISKLNLGFKRLFIILSILVTILSICIDYIIFNSKNIWFGLSIGLTSYWLLFCIISWILDGFKKNTIDDNFINEKDDLSNDLKLKYFFIESI